MAIGLRVELGECGRCVDWNASCPDTIINVGFSKLQKQMNCMFARCGTVDDLERKMNVISERSFALQKDATKGQRILTFTFE